MIWLIARSSGAYQLRPDPVLMFGGRGDACLCCGVRQSALALDKNTSYPTIWCLPRGVHKGVRLSGVLAYR